MRTFFCVLVCLAGALTAAAPATQPAIAPASAPTMQQKCQKVLTDWRAKFDEEGFHYLLAPPFVLAGNGSTEQLEHYRDRTVLAAAKSLHATYFKTQPAEPVLILLFESEGPYK